MGFYARQEILASAVDVNNKYELFFYEELNRCLRKDDYEGAIKIIETTKLNVERNNVVSMSARLNKDKCIADLTKLIDLLESEK